MLLYWFRLDLSTLSSCHEGTSILLTFGPRDTRYEHQCAAHVVDLRAEDVLAADPHFQFRDVTAPRLIGHAPFGCLVRACSESLFWRRFLLMQGSIRPSEKG